MVGMILYFVRSARPDIEYPVHRCAIFSHNPIWLYEIVMKYITWYLQGSEGKVIILSPKHKKLQLGLFEDADFAGSFVSNDK